MLCALLCAMFISMYLTFFFPYHIDNGTFTILSFCFMKLYKITFIY